jgi:lipid A 4'-phosphatase
MLSSRRREPGALTALAAALSGACRLRPGLDLGVSRLFHRLRTGYLLVDKRPAKAVLLATKAPVSGLVAVALVVMLAGTVGQQAPAPFWMRQMSPFVLPNLLGTGLLLNGILKQGFGRARPDQTTPFGVDGPFRMAWQASGQSRSACSFVSAGTASGAALRVRLALGTLWCAGRPAARGLRALALASGALLLLTAARRIGSGRHFRCDMVLAALLVAIPGVALSCLIRPRPSPSCIALSPRAAR